MQTITDAAYEDLYMTAMEGISFKVAMQCIRKIIRNNKTSDAQKLAEIANVIHSHEKAIDKEGN